MIRIGLSSAALLTCDYREVLRLASAAGVDAMEWAGGSHAPQEDFSAAEHLMMETLRAGLTTASYAPLYRLGCSGEAGLPFETVLHAASLLQSPIIRVYVGAPRNGRHAAPPESVEGLAAEARRLGDLAAEKGITLCLSLGRSTRLADYETAESLIAAAGHSFVRMAWEALPDCPAAEASASLSRLGRAAGLMVASRIGRDGSAGRLADEPELWRERVAAFKRSEADPTMASFLFIGAARRAPGSDDPLPGLAEDLAFLRGLVAELEPPRRR